MARVEELIFEVEGNLAAPVSFESVDQIDISLPGGGQFVMPTELTQGSDHHFRMRVDGESEQEAYSEAEQRLASICGWFSYRFDVPVYQTSITSVSPPNGPSHLIGHYDLSLTLTTSLLQADTMAATSDYGGIITASYGGLPVAESVLELYRGAKAQADPVRKFWQYYLILMILIPPTRNDVGDRRAIDEYLRHLDTNAKTYVNDNTNFRGDTLTVALRDTFSHSGSKYNNGQTLDPVQLLPGHIPDLDKMVRQTIGNLLPGA